MLVSRGMCMFVYVVTRDFGFAPNPFHGYCTLATCKPRIRGSAEIGDWVMGVGGVRLKARGKCVYLMKVTEKMTFDDYWRDSRFGVKKPLRNGSAVMMVGDNIYHRDAGNRGWIQEDSHHSNGDGSANMRNLATDTKSENVLISEHFYYFGSAAVEVDLGVIGYKNTRDFRKFELEDGVVRGFIADLEERHADNLNRVAGDPFDFEMAAKRVDQDSGRIS